MPGLDWLANLRVLDLTTQLGALGVRVLSEYGAHVTRIEPPGGDPLRMQPPFATADSGERHSLHWLHMMRGRECRTLDLDTPAGRDAFHELAAASDVVFESQPVGWFTARGIDIEAVLAANPRLVWVSVTPFGRSGPRAGWQATDLIGMAAGGLLSLCGDRDRPPLRVSVEQGYAQAGLQALAGLVVALRGVRQGHPGQLVDVSMQAAIANCLGNARLFYEVDGVPTLRAGGGRATGTQGSRLVYPCADGFVSFARMPDSLHALTEWMREEGIEPGFDAERLAALPQAGRHMAPPELTNAFDAAVEKLFAKLTKATIYEDGQRRGLMTCPVSSPADLLANSQLAFREYWREETVPELGRTVTMPGPPVKLHTVPNRPFALADRPPTPINGLPFEGVRIADFSWVGVAPAATQQLALFGAEVIRIESSRKLDTFRGSGPKRGADPNASAYWANYNRDKRGATLDLKHPRARDLALRLIARSDVVVDSFTPGFMDDVGLSLDAIREANPNIITMSASMEGSTGPHARFRGFGLVLQSTVGFTHFTAWPGRAPVGTGVAYTDWFATHLASFALMSALEHRDRTGEGTSIDLSQLEACAWGLDAELLRYTATGEQRAPLDNRHEAMSPHGVFPAAGTDQWVAVAVRDGDDWAKLADLLGAPWANDPTLAALESRRGREDAIEAAIAAWTSVRDKHECAAALQSAGIPAYAVSAMDDVQTDPQLAHREHFWPITHAELGTVSFDSPAYRLSNLPIRHRTAAPLLGADNEYLYSTLLACDDDALATLATEGALE
ncbi:MAG: CoA transferase [Dehalococcoidia bacterium]